MSRHLWGGNHETKIITMEEEPKIVGYTRDRKGNVTGRHLKETANTIHSSTGSGGNTDQYAATSTAHGNSRLRIRKLTEREVFRLMDVDEHYIDTMLKSGVSRSKLYFAAGNSIVVGCMERMFDNLLFHDEKMINADENGQLSLF